MKWLFLLVTTGLACTLGTARASSLDSDQIEWLESVNLLIDKDQDIRSLSNKVFPFGILVDFEKNQEDKISTCTVTHLGNGIVVTAGRCIGKSLEKTALVFYSASKEGTRKKLIVEDFEVLFQGEAQKIGSVDIAVIRIPDEVSVQLNKAPGSIVYGNKKPWGGLTQLIYEQATVWGFVCDIPEKSCQFISVGCQATRKPIHLLYQKGMFNKLGNTPAEFTNDDILSRKGSIRLEDAQVPLTDSLMGGFVTGSSFRRWLGVFTTSYSTGDLLQGILEGNGVGVIAGSSKIGYAGFEGRIHLYPIPDLRQKQTTSHFVFGVTAPFDNLPREKEAGTPALLQ